MKDGFVCVCVVFLCLIWLRISWPYTNSHGMTKWYFLIQSLFRQNKQISM